MSGAAVATCPLCGGEAAAQVLSEAGWISPEVETRIGLAHPRWCRRDGACPACLQTALLQTLLERGESAFHESIQRLWPLDAEAAFGAIPTPLRLHADPRFLGRGVTIALVDSGFHPHPDLVRPVNRIRAWVDASREVVDHRIFKSDVPPRWPGWDSGAPSQWHGLMTTAVAAGNGALSHGLYRGLAPEAELVLVQVADPSGRIGNAAIARALRWIYRHGPALGVRIVNLSLGGDPVSPLAGNPVDAAVESLVDAGIVVIAAAGNDGVRRLVPPGTAPRALTIGGLDDHGLFSDTDRALWHSNYGESAEGSAKPELVAPSLRVVAPLLPATAVAQEAASLFQRRAIADKSVEVRIAGLRLVTPHYQQVEGTSFAAPIVSGVVAAILEASPGLSPRRVRETLLGAAHLVPGAPEERQGAGAVDAGRAVTLALADIHSKAADFARSPVVGSATVRFLLHEHEAGTIHLLGSWNGWTAPGATARAIEPGLWEAEIPRPPEGLWQYKFLLDGKTWLPDPANPARAHDGLGGLNSALRLPTT